MTAAGLSARPAGKQRESGGMESNRQVGLLLLNVYIIEIKLSAFLNAVLTLTWTYAQLALTALTLLRADSALAPLNTQAPSNRIRAQLGLQGLESKVTWQGVQR